jgi:hypothetical protein
VPHQVNIQFDDQTYDRLRKQAFEQKTNVSALVRALVNRPGTVLTEDEFFVPIIEAEGKLTRSGLVRRLKEIGAIT